MSALLIGGAQGDVRVKKGDASDFSFPHFRFAARTQRSAASSASLLSARKPRRPPEHCSRRRLKGPIRFAPIPRHSRVAGDPRRLSLDLGRAHLIPRAETPYIWTDPPHPIDTPFVKVPGLLSASCVENGQIVYLAVNRNASPNGRRASDIKGDLISIITGKLAPSWGLHLHRRESDDGQSAHHRWR